MRRGTIILILFAVVALGVIGASQFLRSRPPLEVTIAVNPLAEDWVQAAATAFNAREPVVNANRRVAVRVNVIDDIEVWSGNTDWRAGPIEQNTRPSMWLPASSVSVTYATDNQSLPFELAAPSTARTLLVWGGYTERVVALTGFDPVEMDWEDIAISARQESWAEIGGDPAWGFFNLAYPSPSDSTAGMAILLTAAASYHETTDLTSDSIRDPAFREWLEPVARSVPNFQTLGSNPAQAMAQRGTSVASIALLPESQWLPHLAQIGPADSFELRYPEYQFLMDFPLLRWEDETVTPDEAAGVNQFVDWLAAPARQQGTVDFGLRPAEDDPPETASLFVEAESYGITRVFTVNETVNPPRRSDVLALLTWYEQNR